jgi:hypothetical protein
VTAEQTAERDEGAAVLADVERFARRFLVLPTEHDFVVIVLWIAHTWAPSACYVSPRLVLDSPEPGSGKTRVLEVLALLCRSAKLTLSTTTAALYRRIAAAGDQPPTILQDEADAIFGKTATPQSEDLRALFNAGYKRGATVDRCEGDNKNMKVVEFPVFAPLALAGLAGKMPSTITDRAITLHMRRRAPDEQVSEFRERDARADAEPIGQRLEAWAAANLPALTAARPAMSRGVEDRAAELWEALLAVADTAGGDWPQRARDACTHFVVGAHADEKLSPGVRLLRDVQNVFGDRGRMFSADIIAALVASDQSEWSDLRGKPLDTLRLAKELKRYGVRPKDVRIDGSAAKKGYQVDGDDGLGQAWRRYLPQPGAGSRDSRDLGNGAGDDDSDPRHSRDSRDTAATAETPSEQAVLHTVAPVAAVAARDGSAPSPAQMPRRKAPEPRERRRTRAGQPPDQHPACIVCGKRMMCGQGNIHLGCQQGLTARDPLLAQRQSSGHAL